MSYQPEERYWTDYLRIALPVVGLLLMLGLFWYWASNVIGDSGSSNKPSPTAQIAVITESTATATTPSLVQITTVANTPTTAPTTGNSGPATESNSAGNNAGTGNTTANGTTGGNSAGNASGGNAAGNASSGNPSKFGKGDTVVTNDSVNMRSDHSTSAVVVEPLDQGTQLNVTGDGVKDGDYTWIPVDDPNTGSSGWVADTFVDASS